MPRSIWTTQKSGRGELMTGRPAVNFQWYVQRLFHRTYYYIFHDYIFFDSSTCEKTYENKASSIFNFRFFFIFYIFKSIMYRIIFFIIYIFLYIIIFIIFMSVCYCRRSNVRLWKQFFQNKLTDGDGCYDQTKRCENSIAEFHFSIRDERPVCS